jgi:hypothetical protein
LVITPSTHQLANPSSQGGRDAASTIAGLSLWICGRRAHTAQKGLPVAPAHNSTGSTTTRAKLSINELHPLKFQKRQRMYFNYHHTAADTLDKISRHELAENAAAMAVLGFALADMPQSLARSTGSQ